MAFSDAFTRGADENLEASANWTRVNGAAGDLSVNSTTDSVECNTTDSTGALYQCPDQGSANHYTQADAVAVSGTRNYFIACVRASDASNFIGARAGVTNGYQLYERNGGSFSLLDSGAGTPSPGDTLRVEADGNDISVFLNGSGTPFMTATTTFNNTVTRQGMAARSLLTVSGGFADNFEAGTLSAGGVTIPVIYEYRMLSGGLG